MKKLSIVLLSLAFLMTAIIPSTPVHATTPSGKQFDHIVTIMLENTGLADVCGLSAPPCNGGSGQAPYMNSLANNNSLALYYTGLKTTSANGSLTNYLGITAGQTFFSFSNGNCNPNSQSITCHTSAQNIVDLLENAGVN